MKFCDECDYPIIINGSICQRCGKPTETQQDKKFSAEPVEI